jgi:hypothetical protein
MNRKGVVMGENQKPTHVKGDKAKKTAGNNQWTKKTIAKPTDEKERRDGPGGN